MVSCRFETVLDHFTDFKLYLSLTVSVTEDKRQERSKISFRQKHYNAFKTNQ